MNSLIDLTFDPDFYCDEVREGFFVSETMKRYWAAQLKVLAEIDKVCKKHGCNWFADFGTLLGCVRHNGYIPWDDDMDIAMPRDDLNEFLNYAASELPKGYVILDIKNNEEYELPFYRVTNSNAINAGAHFLSEYCGCPFACGVDIFPLDKIYTDTSKEDDRVKRGKHIYQTMIKILKRECSDLELERMIQQIEKENSISIERGNALYRNLLLLFDEISAEANSEDSSEIASMYLWISQGRCKYNASYFEKYKELAFENTKLRVPCRYHEVLLHCYGDYMTVHRGISGHNYPVYRELEGIYREKFGKNPCRYSFDKNEFDTTKKRKPLIEKQNEILALMCSVHEHIGTILDNCSGEEVMPFLQSCQNAALSVRHYIEDKFGCGTDTASFIEQYCEKITFATEGWNTDTKADLDNIVHMIERSINILYSTSGKDILFLPCKVAWWDTMKKAFMDVAADGHNRVAVIPIPFYYHDHEKMLGDFRTDTEEFEKLPELYGKITSFDEYGIEKRHPDMIVIQFPFDGYSGIMGIPELLYSKNLLNYTDELVYIPFANPNPPLSTNDVAYSALQELIEQPAVFQSDRVVVNTSELRKYYLQKLVEMTDESMRQFWEERITTRISD